MAFSCSDFADDTLTLLILAGLLRKEDIPDENPKRQFEMVGDVLTALLKTRAAAMQLASMVTADEQSNERVKLAAELVSNAAAEALPPKYLVCEGYEHCFVGSSSTTTRWAMDLKIGTLVAAEVERGTDWVRLDRTHVADLAEDVISTNAVRETPGDFGATAMERLPDWASKRVES